MSSNSEPYNMDERFDDRWRSDIVESYFDDKFVPLQRQNSNQAVQQNMLTAPPLEKTDSSWSPMSSGLVTPQDSIGFWTVSPDRRRSGRFSLDSVGLFGQSNRWSLGTQLSNISFTELPTQVTECEEDRDLEDKLQEWNTIDSAASLFEDDDKIFHPDDEIILDPKESSEAPIARASIGTRPPEWPNTDTISKRWTSMEDGSRGSRGAQSAVLNQSTASKDRQPLRISTTDPFEVETASSRTSYSFCSDAVPFKYPQYDLPKVTNRRSFVDSPPEILNNDPWPLTGSTSSSSQSGLWSHEKALPPTPRSRGVSVSAPRRDEYPRGRMSGTYDTVRAPALQNSYERPASWNPRYDAASDFALNLDRAILGTSLARSHRTQPTRDESMEEQEHSALESIFNSLKLNEPPSNRSSTTNGSLFRESRNFTWPYDDGYREHFSPPPHSQVKEPTHSGLTESQRQRNVMNRIIYERNLNPTQFDTSPKHARYFVIKSYNEDDVHKSLKFNIWASTEIGNRRLDKAYRESSRAGPIYLFFSVNASGQFCGMARMMSPVDYATSSSVWTQTDKWKGRMDVRWIFVKDIPNSHLRHIRVWNNENKPVTNSRDTQELPSDAGVAMLRIFSDYPSKSSVILTNLVSAEMRTEMAKEETDPAASHVYAEHGYLNNGFQAEDYHRAGEQHQRQSWQSTEEQMRSRQSFQSEQYNYYDSRMSAGPPPLNRRNTIGTAPIGATGRVAPSSTTPTSGMRAYEKATPASSRYHETSTYRSMLSGIASLGDVYGSHRYPPFHDRGHTEDGRYF